LFIELLLKLFSKLPLKVVHFCGWSLGKLLFILNGKTRKLIEKNISICFPWTCDADQRLLVRQSLIEGGKNILELGFIWGRDVKTNLESVVDIVPSGKDIEDGGIIFMAPHFGCWELAVRLTAYLDDPTTVLYKPFRDGQIENLVLDYRSQGNLIMASSAQGGVFKLSKALKNGRNICILPDQDPRLAGSIEASFFGKQVRTMSLLSKLALKHKSEVILVYAIRLPYGRGYKVVFENLDFPVDDISVEDSVGVMNQHLERLIRKYPSQYMWGYNRFKTNID